MIGLDTNLLIRFFMQDDGPQAEAVSLLLEQELTEEEPGFISIGTLLETVWVLKSKYRVPNSDLVLVLENLLRTTTIALQHRPEVTRAFAAFQAGPGSFSDLLIGELNAAAGCSTTLTFDKGASRLRGFSLLRT